ncbi:hypothetical protein BGZ94_000723 [Podila epigama]|nr:hypothetical protein BGZ94_000723 [Podila epigama]
MDTESAAPPIPLPIAGPEHSHTQQQQTPPPEDTDPFIVVRALYPYHSEDPTALSFLQNDLIQVVAQLESGWWYGFCHDARGWFPSNFVEEIDLKDEDHDLDSDTSEDEMASSFTTCLLLLLPQHIITTRMQHSKTCQSGSSGLVPIL